MGGQVATQQHAAQAANTDRVTSRTKQLLPELLSVFTLARRGVVRPMRPDKLVRVALAWRRWGITPTLGYTIGAIRHPDRPAVIDERGALSYAELENRSTRLAHGLAGRGADSGTRVGVLCRNHHGLVETLLACAKIGADVVLLNTGLSAQQVSTVLAEQRVQLLVADTEFAEQLTDAPARTDVVLAWTEGTTDQPTLEHLIATSPAKPLPSSPRHGRVILLTSGTTGSPKGAGRPEPPGLSPAATIFARVPLNSGERVLVSAPLFHTWGFAAFQFGAVLGATLVLRRRFEPQQALATLQRHRCTSMFAVPVMLQRIMELPEETRAPYDTSALRIVACAGSALPAGLATRVQDALGPVLYNFYGTTEVSWASIATPEDLQRAPDTAGRPCRGTQVRILDDNGNALPTGETGRIFVGNNMLFEGYTNGTTKEVHEGLMSTGDLGRFDESGRLYIVGREDDMIVSGGENVYPKETEDVIAGLPGVVETAVIGVPDPEFGQRLAAFVVPHEHAGLDSEGVRDSVREKLSRFAVPREVIFLDELPRNATGKVVPRMLRERWEATTNPRGA